MPDAEMYAEGGNMEENQDTLARAYAMLSALRRNIGQMTTDHVLETYVSEYHAVLDRLEGIGIDVAEFRISDSVVKPKILTRTSHSGGRESITYSEEKYVERSFILTKLDAIIGYFEIITSEKPQKIGYHPPEK